MPKVVTLRMLAEREARGRRIVQALAFADLSQTELAKRLKINVGNLNRVLTGERVLDERMAEIAHACGVDPDWLTSGQGRGPEAKTNTPKRVRRGVQASNARYTEAVEAAQVAKLVPLARGAWRLSDALAERTLATIAASGLTAKAKRTDAVYVVVVPAQR